MEKLDPFKMYFIVFPIKDGDIPARYVIVYQRVEKELSEMEHPGWNMIPFQSDLTICFWNSGMVVWSLASQVVIDVYPMTHPWDWCIYLHENHKNQPFM